MDASAATGDDTLSRAIGNARLAGLSMVLIVATAVLWASATVTIPNAVIISGTVRSGAPVVNLRHPIPAYLVGTSVVLGTEVRRGEAILELKQVSVNGTAEAVQMISPLDGTVTALHYAAKGSLIPAFDTIVVITPGDPAPLIELEIDPAHADHFQTGSLMPMAAGDGPASREISAKVLSIGFPAHGDTRSTVMRAVLKPIPAGSGTRDFLRPGMAVSTRILQGERSLLGSLLHPASRILGEAFSRR